MKNEFDLSTDKVAYYKALLGVFAVGGGIAWLIEHYLSFGYLEFELFGHETYAVILILIGAYEALKYYTRKPQ